mgnify:CR=1 FL=1|tara:strand:+ start:620 stop:1333 length:714 start_codon:yes stop_codon:yes gene_type:complete
MTLSTQPTKVQFKIKTKTPSQNQTIATPTTPSTPSPLKLQFRLKGTNPNNKFKFKIKPKSNKPKFNPKTQFTDFVNFCLNNRLPYFQFFDVDNWRGPATKIEQSDLDHLLQLFDEAQDFLHTIVLNGYGFAIVKPIQHLDDSNIVYKDSYFDACKFTDEPMIPYNSDMDVDDDDSDYDATTDEEIEVEEEFIAEEWTYDGVMYLLDTSTNYLYFPSTLEFIGKKTGEFSIDFNAKER